MFCVHHLISLQACDWRRNGEQIFHIPVEHGFGLNLSRTVHVKVAEAEPQTISSGYIHIHLLCTTVIIEKEQASACHAYRVGVHRIMSAMHRIFFSHIRSFLMDCIRCRFFVVCIYNITLHLGRRFLSRVFVRGYESGLQQQL